MKLIPDFVWFLLWAFPFRVLGVVWQHLQFIYWSAEHEFKAGTTWVLERRIKTTLSGGQPSEGADQ